jgi:hypothetical protein
MSMTPLNPLTGALFAGSQVQERQSREKVDEARRALAAKRNIVERDDDVAEHQVENTQDVPAIEDEPHESPGGKRRRRRAGESEAQPGDDSPGLDVRA